MLRTVGWGAGATVWAVCAALGLAAGGCGTDSSKGNEGDAAADHTEGLSDGNVADAGSADDVTPSEGGGFSVPDGCSPATQCPPGVECGRYTDPCSGEVFACGSGCDGGQICVASPNDPKSQTCQPKTCTGKCGVVGSDACGVAVNCGTCAAGDSCVNNTCVPNDAGPPPDAGQCPVLTCTPAAQTALCGTVTDGCGHTMACSCPSGQQCIAGQCSPTPPECTSADGGESCGTVANSCGSGKVTCPSKCSGNSECVSGQCTACTPPTCGARTCGQVSNGCGPAVTCGSCATGDSCYDGGCCTPRTCADAIDAGEVTGCNPVNLGCGISQSCSRCPTSEVCANDACVACVPKTCADFQNTGCGHSDGCGKTLNCCSSNTTCTNNVCCGEGEIGYNGGCCAPGCDPTQPPGPQVSCGQVIYCAGSGGGPR
jgi:hypothetical protein